MFVVLTTAVLFFFEFNDSDSGLGASGGLLRHDVKSNNGNTPFVKNKRTSEFLLVNFYRTDMIFERS